MFVTCTQDLETQTGYTVVDHRLYHQGKLGLVKACPIDSVDCSMISKNNFLLRIIMFHE